MNTNNPVVVLYTLAFFAFSIWLAYILFEDLRRKGVLSDWKAVLGHIFVWVLILGIFSGTSTTMFGLRPFGFAKATNKFATNAGTDIGDTPIGQMKFPNVGYTSAPAETAPDFGEVPNTSEAPPSFSSGSPSVPDTGGFQAPVQPAPTATPKPEWQIIGDAPLELFAADYKRAGLDLLGDSSQASRAQFPQGMICRADKQYQAPNMIIPDGSEDWHLLCWLDTTIQPYNTQKVTIPVNGHVVEGLGVHSDGREFRGVGELANWPQMFREKGTSSNTSNADSTTDGRPLCPDQRPAIDVTLPDGTWVWDCSGA